MYAGVDFGTSNCSIGVWKDNQPNLLSLGSGSPLVASALYTSRAHVTLEQIDGSELKKRVGVAKRRQTSEVAMANAEGRSIKELSDDELANIERGIMRRELAQRARRRYAQQSIGEALYADSETVFGEDAIRRHIEDPQSGYFIKSPKSFLGADIKHHHIELFSEIVTRMLAHIRNLAEQQVHCQLDRIVLGRPVNFHGTRGSDGNKQALGILERSAVAAGFTDVEFLMEPMAAALDYERSLTEDVIVLVLDAGGGTTDCSMVKVGPSYREMNNREGSVLGYSGDRVGGTDIDVKLAMRTIMPFFGKDTLLNNRLPIPSGVYWDAVKTNDVNSQARFLSDKTRRDVASYLGRAVEKNKVQRLVTLQRGRYSYRLNRSAELAKIDLSEQELICLPLYYIEPELLIPITRSELKASIARELEVFALLMKEVERQAGTTPDIIYVTGGTAKSPIIQELIRLNFHDVDIVVGDLFGSVTSGLTTWAHRIYQ